MSAHLHLTFDAHTHLHLDQTEEGRRASDALLSQLKGAALMSTEPPDWARAAQLAQRHPHVRCLFGVHPWFAHSYADQLSWLDQLRDHLRETPGSAIGEIGLDKQWRPPGLGVVQYEAQLKVFKAQLNLAAELALPVSIHCVRAQGDLQAILSAAPRLPPTLYLHAFGGRRGTVEQLVKAKGYGGRLYFGFAACVNLRSPKGREAISAVPPDRLVLETDRSSAKVEGRLESELTQMLHIYAELQGWRGGVEEAAQRTSENAQRLYAPADRLRGDLDQG